SLSITSALPTSAFPNSNPGLRGSSFDLTSTTMDGNGNATTVLTFNIGTATTTLTNGNFRLGGLVAYVPLTAPYRSKQLIHISSTINGGAIPTINDDALQIVAYVGNGTGAGTYSSNDAGKML